MNELEKKNFLSFINTFKNDKQFKNFLNYRVLTIEEFNAMYNLEKTKDIEYLISDIFNYLYNLSGIECVKSYKRETCSTNLNLEIERVVYFKNYELYVLVNINSRTYEEQPLNAILKILNVN